jgi:hypothetical protein
MQALEESATGAGTNLIKVRMLSQGRALGKVVQEGVKEGRANVAAVGGAERVPAAREGGGSDRSGVIQYHSLCFRVSFVEFGVYCAIGGVYLVLGRPSLNLLPFPHTVVANSPSFENFEVFN